MASPFAEAFRDELLKTGGLRPSGENALVRRLATGGALAGGGHYAVQKAMAAAGRGPDPADSGDSLLRRMAVTGASGGAVALLIKALSKRR